MLFVPNVHDASPRVISESLILGHGIVVNSRILGGWKYVRPSSGEFFDESEPFAVERVVGAVGRLVNMSVRGEIDNSFYSQEYGRRRAGRRLARFLRAQGVRWNGTDSHLWIEPG